MRPACRTPLSHRDARNPQFGAAAPPRPAWGTGHAAAADEYSSRSPRAPSPASEDTRPWHTPAITPEDLDPQHFDDDEDDGSHSAFKGGPGAHDLVYRTTGESKPKPEFQDLLYRYNGSPEEAKDHRRGFYQNVAGKSKNPAPQPPSNPPKDQDNATNPPPPPKPSTTRLLTEGEKELVRSIFGNSIKDLDKVEIRNRNFIPFQRRGTTMTPNGNMYPGKNLRSVSDFSKESDDLRAHLIHEMTHVWQHQNGMSVKARGLMSWMAPYDYKIETEKEFSKYSMEQQATIIADYFLSLQGVRVRPQYRDDTKDFFLHTPAEYEALIPWLKDLRKNAPKPPVIPSPQPLP